MTRTEAWECAQRLCGLRNAIKQLRNDGIFTGEIARRFGVVTLRTHRGVDVAKPYEVVQFYGTAFLAVNRYLLSCVETRLRNELKEERNGQE